MAKFSGVIGYSESVETSPGVWTQKITERKARGDVLRNYRKWEGTENLNDNLVINNTISIVADKYAYDHIFAIKYVKYMGVEWKVENVEIQPPRLILSLGGVYNGEKSS